MSKTYIVAVEDLFRVEAESEEEAEREVAMEVGRNPDFAVYDTKVVEVEE